MVESSQHALIKLARSVEDVAAGLHVFRDSLPRDATRITASIGQLFAISSVLRRLDAAQSDRRNQPSFYRIRDDIGLAIPSLRYTIDAVLDMFARSRERPRQMVWDDLEHRMKHDEGSGLRERLGVYEDFFKAQLDIVTGYQPHGLRGLRRDLLILLDAQDAMAKRYQRHVIAESSSTPRPRPARPAIYRIDTPLSPTVLSDTWDYDRPPPAAPEPPMSPGYTSGSSPTLSSSHTSYSNEPFYQAQQQQSVHWASEVFDGTNPVTAFPPGYQLEDRSSCHGSADLTALQHLGGDGFYRALELPFDRGQLWIRLYWRPPDDRARILVMTKDAMRRDLHYCTPLNALKIIRNKSCLQLCRARQDGRYILWARLNFLLYERMFTQQIASRFCDADDWPGMVLFYCTFVAMKNQDRRGIPHQDLIDDFELRHEEGEYEIFGGKIKDDDLRHALRMFKDRGSGVVRLEACALRGAMKDVPIWTAFITRYAHDPDWAQLEHGGIVSLAAFRPPPYIFLSGYEPPRNVNGEYLLHFTTTDDARQFMESWIGLCRGA